MGKPQPAVPQTQVCLIGRRCHISGKGLTRFGTKFSSAKVRQIASSSVLLLDQPAGQPPTPVASGTLISDNVVLCAAHSVPSLGQSAKILMFYECDKNTAPPGSSDQYNMSDPASVSAWRGCTKLRSAPQAELVKVLEQGSPDDLDYALLSIRWTTLKPDPKADIVEMPRYPVAAAPSRNFSSEVLVVGHPIVVVGHPPPQNMADAEPTEASAGQLHQQFGPNSETNKGQDYGYAGFVSQFGMSGGGVFNEEGHIIGVLKGRKAGKGECFLNLARAADALPTSRLGIWVNQGGLLKPGDPNQIVVFVLAP
jgi:hypothetical protein